MAQNIDNVVVDNDKIYSAGLHPWHIDSCDTQKCLNNIDNLASEGKIVAVGETGLDRKTAIFIDKQVEIFKAQIAIAQKHNLPVIIHCVKAYSDIIAIKKRVRTKIPFIIHGYNANESTTKQLIKHGFYFSIGKMLFNENTYVCDVIKIIPKGQLFFETDESEYNIHDIYEKAAGLLKIDIKNLCHIVTINFNRIFKLLQKNDI